MKESFTPLVILVYTLRLDLSVISVSNDVSS